MAMNDLFQALSMFTDGMQQLAVTKGIQNATAAVDQLNQSGLDELQKRQQQQTLAKQLSLQLLGAGANAQQVQQAYSAVAPQAITSSGEAYQQAVQTGDKGLMSMAKDMQKFEEAPKVEQLKIQGQTSRDVATINGEYDVKKTLLANTNKTAKAMTDKELEVIINAQQALEQTAAKNFSAVEHAKTAKAMLDSNNPLADNSIGTFMARATGEVGNLTEAEREPFGGSMALADRIQRVSKKLATGKIPDEDREFIKQLATTLENRNKAAIETHADRISRQRAAALGRDPSELRSRILPSDYATAIGGQQKTAGPQLPPGVPEGSRLETRISKSTKQPVQVWVAPNGALYPAK